MEHNRYPDLSFNEDTHEYYYGELVLPGITGTIKRLCFPDKYKGIPEHILEAAAARGTEIHKLLETADVFDDYITQEQILYKDLRDSMGWKHYGSEVLVTNDETHATAIDKVYWNEDGTVDIVDIKSTDKLDEEYLAWQLSIGAMMYEHCFGVKVRKTWAIWMKKDLSHAEVVEITKRIPENECKRLLKADADGEETFESEYISKNEWTELPEEDAEELTGIINELAAIDAQNKLNKVRTDELKKRVNEVFKSTGAQSWKLPQVTIFHKEESEKVVVDAELLQEIAPEVFAKVSKVTKVRASINYSFKKS